jgi:hypothetical protein
MKPCIWWHTADRSPDKKGYYLAYKGPSFGDDSSGIRRYYYDNKTGNWTTGSTMQDHGVNVYYWTDADPGEWVESDPPVKFRPRPTQNITLESAWKEVLTAIEKYNIISALSR